MALQFPAQQPEDFLNLSILSVFSVAAHLNAFGQIERINGAQPAGVSQMTQDINGNPLFYGRVSIPLNRDHAGQPAWDCLSSPAYPLRTMRTAFASALAGFDDSQKMLRLAAYSLLGYAAHYKGAIEEGSSIGQRYTVETDLTQNAEGDPIFIGSCAILCLPEAADGQTPWLYPDVDHQADRAVFTNALASFAGAAA